MIELVPRRGLAQLEELQAAELRWRNRPLADAARRYLAARSTAAGAEAMARTVAEVLAGVERLRAAEIDLPGASRPGYVRAVIGDVAEILAELARAEAELAAIPLHDLDRAVAAFRGLDPSELRGTDRPVAYDPEAGVFELAGGGRLRVRV